MFNPNEHLMKLKGRDYLEVKWRLVWFRDAHPKGIIETKMLHLDLERGQAVFQAVIHDGEGGQASGHGSETARDFPDFIEKAETKAIGRALAALGFGTQFTGDELDELPRVVDSPVQASAPTRTAPGNGKAPVLARPAPVLARSGQAPGGTGKAQGEPTTVNLPLPATAQQRAAIAELCKKLDRDLPANLDALTEPEARDTISLLVAAYRARPMFVSRPPSAPASAQSPGTSS